MKKQFKFFSALFAAAAMMASCSNDEPVNPGTPGEEGVYGDSYLSVSLAMPTSINGRAEGQADNDKDKYEDGTEAESKVNNVFFFFFDSNNNVIDIQKFDDVEFEKNLTPNKNPYVTSYGTKEVRLKSGLDYKQVAVAINSSVESASDFRSIKNLSDLENHGHEYLTNLTKNGQVMSNSVYYDRLNDEGKSTYTVQTTPNEADKVILVPITAKNIYTSAERNTIKELLEKGEKEYVDIYVERVLAKVEVTSSIDLDKFYISDENKTQIITLYDNANLTTKFVKVKPVILGTTLNVLTNDAKLIKPILASQVGYGVGDPYSYKDFQWNDPINKRSYWANTESKSTKEMTYYTWEQAKNNVTQFNQYIHPNTQDYEPTADNENNSLNTKVMIVAQLKGIEVDADGNELGTEVNLDIVRYGSEYMEKSNFLAHVANFVTIAMRGESWSDYTSVEKEILDVLLINSLADKTVDGKVQTVITSDMFEIGKLSSDSNGAYEAVVRKTDNYTFALTGTAADADFFKYTQAEVDAMSEAEKAEAEANGFFKNVAVAEYFTTKDEEGNLTKLNALIARANVTLAAVSDKAMSKEEEDGGINKIQILYWKDGMTYYYTTIKQQGFYGLVGGGADNYLNGVVRNHVYKVNLTGFYGLGTPVIDPKSPIDPERPEIDRPSYLQARINVLPWRIVTNDATLH